MSCKSIVRLSIICNLFLGRDNYLSHEGIRAGAGEYYYNEVGSQGMPQKYLIEYYKYYKNK